LITVNGIGRTGIGDFLCKVRVCWKAEETSLRCGGCAPNEYEALAMPTLTPYLSTWLVY